MSVSAEHVQSMKNTFALLWLDISAIMTAMHNMWCGLNYQTLSCVSLPYKLFFLSILYILSLCSKE